MIRRIKLWLLKKLVNDISTKAIKRRGCAYFGDIRAGAEITYLAMYAYELRPDDVEPKEDE